MKKTIVQLISESKMYTVKIGNILYGLTEIYSYDDKNYEYHVYRADKKEISPKEIAKVIRVVKADRKTE